MPYFKRLLGTQEEAIQEAERAKLYMTDPTPWVTAIQGDPFLRRWAWELRTTQGFLQRPHGPEIPWEHHATLSLEENAAPLLNVWVAKSKDHTVYGTTPEDAFHELWMLEAWHQPANLLAHPKPLKPISKEAAEELLEFYHTLKAKANPLDIGIGFLALGAGATLGYLTNLLLS